MKKISFNLIKKNTVQEKKMNLYKHKIFINDKLLEYFNFEEALNNGKTQKGIEGQTRVYLKKTFEKIDENYYLLWVVRDSPVVDENDELVQGKEARIEYDVDFLIEQDINRVNNYFVVFDKKNSEIYTTNSTGNASSPNKELIKYFLNADIVDISSEVSYSETLKKAKAETLVIKYHDAVQTSLFNNREISESLLRKPKEYFGAEFVVSQKFIINDNLFKSLGAAARLDSMSTDENCIIYLEATDEDGNEFSIDNRVIKKPTKITEDNIKIGSDMYDQIIKFIDDIMEEK